MSQGREISSSRISEQSWALFSDMNTDSIIWHKENSLVTEISYWCLQMSHRVTWHRSMFCFMPYTDHKKQTCKSTGLHLIASIPEVKSKKYLTRMKTWHEVIFLLCPYDSFSALYLFQASIKGFFEVHLWKFLIIDSAMGNNSNKFSSNALSQWSNERYFANNWSLSSYCALKGEGAVTEWAVTIVLASAGFRRNRAPWHTRVSQD